MNLKDVKSFGTEGRRDGKSEIPAHENVIPSVVFKVGHIKDFKIIERPKTEKEADKTETQALQEEDDAIVSASVKTNDSIYDTVVDSSDKGIRDLESW